MMSLSFCLIIWTFIDDTNILIRSNFGGYIPINVSYSVIHNTYTNRFWNSLINSFKTLLKSLSQFSFYFTG